MSSVFCRGDAKTGLVWGWARRQSRKLTDGRGMFQRGRSTRFNCRRLLVRYTIAFPPNTPVLVMQSWHIFTNRADTGQDPWEQLRTFINQHQAEIVSCRILLVDIAECGREVESAEEQADGNSFTCHGSATLMVSIMALQWERVEFLGQPREKTGVSN